MPHLGSTRHFYAFLIAWMLVPTGVARAEEPPSIAKVSSHLQQYCFDCHGHDTAEANINIESLCDRPQFGRRFKDWEKVISMLQQQQMPPADMAQPTDSERTNIIASIDNALGSYIQSHAGDPGVVVMRRLTSAEYTYTIEDLTGLELRVAEQFAGDAAGGEGFANVGTAQFMQDSALERYLEAAKIVASHAVIGAGPLDFFPDPGETGRELSAITRIQRIYRQHGFRTAAGEGGEPFGLDLYPRAMFVTWQYRFRKELGVTATSLSELARQEGVSPRFCEHLWRVMNTKAATFPLSEVIAQWSSLPPPKDASEFPSRLAEIREACDDLCDQLREWQSTLAAAAGDEEEASVLTAGEVHVEPKHEFRADLSWAEAAKFAEFELAISAASKHSVSNALVVWRNPRLRFRHLDGRRGRFQPLSSFVSEDTAARLRFGQHPAGGDITADDFVLAGGTATSVLLQIPEGMRAAQLVVDVELDIDHGSSSIVRCRISDGEVEGETAAEIGATSTLLADPKNSHVAEWQLGVAEFARVLPEVSQREPAPSDRDPIPAPFDNTYNEPERNHFHSSIKYHRDDAFFVEHIADQETRIRLDQAWTDLLTSFEYHDLNLRFVGEKFNLEVDDKGIDQLDEDDLQRMPADVQAHVRRWRNEFVSMHQSLLSAEPGHVEDVLQFASLAWRRPLEPAEKRQLGSFYAELREEYEFSHDRAIRAVLARILVSPGFLYRAEAPSQQHHGILPLSAWQLASRLSYFIWSSGPDEELRRLAATGQLRETGQLAAQAQRMLHDAKSRRLATEFFGQWFGFYRFDQFNGIDAKRFPDFTDTLQSAMYDEAVSFFTHIIHHDRPLDEILFADYALWNRQLAQHYGVEDGQLDEHTLNRVDNVTAHHRGGLLGLGAVLTVTSAPLRTSAVKRGDWVLRRIVGTPVPPPPADAGSIPADDVLADGLTIRQRLEAHRADVSCVNCHSRIDPLGFALEHYDPVGRWRDKYRDGQPIDPSGTLADGTSITGPDGLREYLRREKKLFHRNLSAKLLGYALGRSELASDRPLIAGMMSDIEAGGTLSDLLVRIVTSEQFRHQKVE